jgi:hypothetical protein
LNATNLAVGLKTSFAYSTFVAGGLFPVAGKGSLVAGLLTAGSGIVMEYALLNKLAEMEGYESFFDQVKEACGF